MHITDTQGGILSKKILAGKRYEDQSTPLAAWLTCVGSAVNEDFDLYAQSKHFTQSPDEFRDDAEQTRYWADKIDVFHAHDWLVATAGIGLKHVFRKPLLEPCTPLR